MKSNIAGEVDIQNKNVLLLEGFKGNVISTGENKRSLLLKTENKEEKEIYFDSDKIEDVSGKHIASYHLYDKNKEIIAKDSIVVSEGHRIFNKEMIESFFELTHSPKRTKEYLAGILSLMLFSICIFLFLSDALKFSYGFKELFHIKELLFVAISLFFINVFFVKKNNNIVKSAINSFYKRIAEIKVLNKGVEIEVLLSKNLKLGNKNFEIIENKNKSLFFKTSKLIKETHEVTITEKENVSSDYNPITNTETIIYTEKDRILSSRDSSYYSLNIGDNRIKRIGVLNLDFKDEENLKYFDIRDTTTGKIYEDKVIKKNDIFSYIRRVNGNTTTENDLLKVFKIPFFNVPILTLLFFIFVCYNYFKGDIHLAAITMLTYFVLLLVRFIRKFYELKKKDELDYDMKVFCHKIRNNL